MHDALFAQHQDLSQPEGACDCERAGKDMQRFFRRDLTFARIATGFAAPQHCRYGDRVGVPGTPTLFVDGQRLNGACHGGGVEARIEAKLKQPAKEAKTASVSASH